MQTQINSDNAFQRPFPALTPAQRYHLDVYGYVVIEKTLTESQVGELLEALQKLKRDFLATPEPTQTVVRGCRVSALRPQHIHFAHVLETDPAVLGYLAHPRLVGMAEELVGGPVRLEESEAIINARDPQLDPKPPARYGFHTGTRPHYGTYTQNGLYHCNFVKTLTNLTELGPDDGGTVVIAGSHKVACSQDEIIGCAYADPSLIHQVIAPAGSTLLFGEALIHATGQIRSDRERAIIIGGYTPTMFQAWNGQEPSAEFVAQTPAALKPLISGSDKWRWQPRFRTLGMELEE
ncbi:MAG: phytanoyl-CoA dioxygenase family protein [Caldilineaceae bacterium]|nr:phytanoyl-CoA dioxygenase family protein [Caldilineaceae bacterium]MCB0099336.1 phytanoyl-CoA dioxygenase family protein [Caldilineaceae bacterium]